MKLLYRSTEKKLKQTEGMTILEAARSAEINIPTLCHHEELEPFGGCRICIVEAETPNWTKAPCCLYLPGRTKFGN